MPSANPTLLMRLLVSVRRPPVPDPPHAYTICRMSRYRGHAVLVVVYVNAVGATFARTSASPYVPLLCPPVPRQTPFPSQLAVPYIHALCSRMYSLAMQAFACFLRVRRWWRTMIAIKPSMTNTIGTTIAVSGGFDNNAVVLVAEVCVDLDCFGRCGAVTAFLDG